MKKIKNQKINKVFFEKINKAFFLLFIFLIPTQLGKHFFPSYSYLNGIRVDYLSPTVYLSDIIVFILFLLNIKTVISFFKNKKVIFILGMFLINVILANNKFLSMYKLLKIIEFIIVFSLGRIVLKIIKEKALLIVLTLVGLFQLLLTFSQFVYQHSLQGFFYFFGERLFSMSTPGIAKATLNGIEFLRPYGTFSHPNSLAGFFLLLYFFVLTNKKFNKYLLLKYFILLLFSILIFISFSKTAIIAFLITNTFYWLRNNKIKCILCKITRVIIPLVISTIFLSAVTDPLTINKRIELTKNSFSIIKNNLLTGVGLGNYLIAQSKIPSKFPLFFNQPVHNIFLLLISETGIFIGLLLLIIFIYLAKDNPYIFLVILITGFFDHYWLTLEQNFLLFAFVYGSVSIDFFIDRFNLRS